MNAIDERDLRGIVLPAADFAGDGDHFVNVCALANVVTDCKVH